MNDILKWLHEGCLLLMMGSDYRPGIWLLSFSPALGRSGVIFDHSWFSRIPLDSGLIFSFAGSVLVSGRERRPLLPELRVSMSKHTWAEPEQSLSNPSTPGVSLPTISGPYFGPAPLCVLAMVSWPILPRCPFFFPLAMAPNRALRLELVSLQPLGVFPARG